jgi:hypothetical protein
MNERPVHVNFGTTWIERTVTLVDGTEVSNYSQEWRHQCEAQHILNMPSKQARQVLLSEIENRRGSPARRALENLILALWKAKQPPATAA